MKINLAKSAGFCFGVRRALNIAFKTASTNSNVCMLGDIVHNEQVVNAIKDIGIKKIKKLSGGTGKGKILVIQAHGRSRNIFTKAKLLGYKIVDATCPMVKEIHRIAREMEKKKYRVIIIGDKKHDEVQGIIGQLKSQAIVIEDLAKIPFKIITKVKKACVVVQSTQNLRNVLRIIEVLDRRIKELKFFNTICKPTRIKQEEMRALPLKNDVVIIIGSKSSANTKRLYQISKSLNINSYWINSLAEINPEWFRKAKNVGVTAGASTPQSTIKNILKFIRSIAS